MARIIELGLCTLLALGGLAHLGGTLVGYEPGTEVFVWSLSAAAFVFTVVFLHALRIAHPTDGWIAAGAITATIAWIVLAFAFGAATGDILDPRALIHVVIALLLLVMAVRGWTGRQQD